MTGNRYDTAPHVSKSTYPSVKDYKMKKNESDWFARAAGCLSINYLLRWGTLKRMDDGCSP